MDGPGILADFSLVVSHHVNHLIGVRSSTTHGIATFVYEVEILHEDELINVERRLKMDHRILSIRSENPFKPVSS